MEEIWKDVVGYEGIYCVSSTGSVKSVDRLITDSLGRKTIYKGVVLSTMLKNKYKTVNLYKRRKMKTVTVHRLVAIAFIENKLKLSHINHKNLIKTDNRVSNLEWCTCGENIRHYWDTVKPVVPKGYDNKFSKAIVQMSKDMSFIADFGSIGEAERITSMCRSAISKNLMGHTHTSYGCVWMYKNDYDSYIKIKNGQTGSN